MVRIFRISITACRPINRSGLDTDATRSWLVGYENIYLLSEPIYPFTNVPVWLNGTGMIIIKPYSFRSIPVDLNNKYFNPNLLTLHTHSLPLSLLPLQEHLSALPSLIASPHPTSPSPSLDQIQSSSESPHPLTIRSDLTHLASFSLDLYLQPKVKSR